jgi:putative CocE/NonD family hydrolase
MKTSLNAKYSVRTLFDQKIKMRDGTYLSTDLILPAEPGNFPTILTRTPYGNHDPLRLAFKYWMAERGFAYAFQDCRGRHDSSGIWEPFRSERNDAFDTLDWLSKQNFCNGSIGMTGGSYEGYCCWVAAPNAHPSLKAMAPMVPLPDPVLNVPYQNGAFFWNMIVWGLMVFGRTNQCTKNIPWTNYYQALPLGDMDKMIGMDSQTWQNWMSHPTFDSWWKEVCYMHQYCDVDIPILHICGWYDDDGISTYRNFPGMREQAKSDRVRDAQELIIGCWPHQINKSTKVGELDFGENALIDLNQKLLQFFAKHLAGEFHDLKPKKRCEIFVMGENKWHQFSDWPIPGSIPSKLFLREEGRLEFYPPTSKEIPDRYLYDPKNPVPYVTDPVALQLGEACDQREIENRKDVMVFSTDILNQDIVVCGRVFVELYFSTDVPATDFTGKLVDVYPDLRAIQVCDGIQRAEYRNSLEKPEWLERDQIYKLTIDLWATGLRFLKGHRIRLEISSSAVPKFFPHANTVRDQARETITAVANQVIYHDQDHPSALVLTIVPEEILEREG